MGLIGNKLFVVVLLQDKVTPTTFLLIALGIADNLYLISFAIFACKQMTTWSEKAVVPREIGVYLFILYFPLESLTWAFSMWLTVLVAVTRYIAVEHPFHARNYITFTRVIVATATLMIFFSLFHFPYYAYASSRLCYLDDTCSYNKTLFDDMKTHVTMFEGFYDIIKEIMVLVLPLILLICFSGSLIRAYQRTRITIRNISASQVRDEAQVTLMTIMVVVVVIICQVPWLVERIISHFMDWQTTIALLRAITQLLKAINSAVNFVIYSLCRKYFRQKLYALCSSCKK